MNNNNNVVWLKRCLKKLGSSYKLVSINELDESWYPFVFMCGIQILDFDTRAGADFVVIGSGLDFSETTLYTLSGSRANAGTAPIPDKVLSPGQHLWISFKTSEATLDHAGFQMAVTMVTQGEIMF